MATVGTFTKNENGAGFTGAVKTLTLNVAMAKFVPTEGESERGPDFRIFAGATEFGAAWNEDRPRDAARISLRQAGRSELPRTHLRQPGRGRGRRSPFIWSRRNGD